MHTSFINNLITIEGYEIVYTIVITKHLDNNTKLSNIMLRYDSMEGVTNQKEKIFFAIGPDLLTIDTITLLGSKILTIVIIDAKFGSGDLNFNFSHSKREITIYDIPTRIQV
jgi:hypothetical protein